MAFNIMKMLGLERKDPVIGDSSRTYQSLTEIPVGSTLNDTILGALKEGKGIGFGSDYTSRVTNPAVAQREYRFAKKELPALSGELSGRGLGRSSIAGQQIGESMGQKERDINSYLAEAYAQDEAQKKLDQARYENLGMQWTGAEAKQKGAYTTQAREDEANQLEREYAKSAEKQQNINDSFAMALKYGVPLALAPFTGGASLSGLGASGLGDLSKMLGQVKEAETASPFTKRVKNTAFSSLNTSSFAPSYA